MRLHQCEGIERCEPGRVLSVLDIEIITDATFEARNAGLDGHLVEAGSFSQGL